MLKNRPLYLDNSRIHPLVLSQRRYLLQCHLCLLPCTQLQLTLRPYLPLYYNHGHRFPQSLQPTLSHTHHLVHPGEIVAHPYLLYPHSLALEVANMDHQYRSRRMGKPMLPTEAVAFDMILHPHYHLNHTDNRHSENQITNAVQLVL